MNNTKKRLGGWAILVALLLLIPYFFMPLWTPGDFVFAAVILFGSASIYEMLTRNMRNPDRRMAVALIVGAILAFVWVFAATGFEGVPTHPVTLYLKGISNSLW